jgi:uncharacterized membrane protein YkvA (DUF1232 family)
MPSIRRHTIRERRGPPTPSPLVIAAYVVSPIDLAPDVIAVLRQLDGGILVPLGIVVATRLMASDVLDERRRRPASFAETPTDWRGGAAAIASWALAAPGSLVC